MKKPMYSWWAKYMFWEKHGFPYPLDIDENLPIKIQGHRGFPDEYPENTMTAFRECYSVGAAMEFDVRYTADGEYIIMHDETVDRTTDGTGIVKSLNYYGYIDTLDAGSWFGTEFAGEKVPTLDDVINEFRNTNATLVLQMYFTGDERVMNIHDVVDKIVNANMVDQVMFFAPPDDINEAKAYNNTIYTLNSGMATIDNYQSILDNAIQNNHNAVSISSNNSDTSLNEIIPAIKDAGKEVHVSYLTSSYESRVQRFINFEADYILGNNPRIMMDYVRSL